MDCDQQVTCVEIRKTHLKGQELRFPYFSRMLGAVDSVSCACTPHGLNRFFSILPLEILEPFGYDVVQVLEVRTIAGAVRLLAGGILHQGVDLDDIGAPVRELPHAGRPRADAGEIKHGEAGQGLRGAREGHSRDSRRVKPETGFCLIGQINLKFDSRSRACRPRCSRWSPKALWDSIIRLRSPVRRNSAHASPHPGCLIVLAEQERGRLRKAVATVDALTAIGGLRTGPP